MFAILLTLISFLTIVLLLSWYNKQGYAKENKNRKLASKTKAQAQQKGLLVTCPLCNSSLMPGEDLATRVYRPMNVPHQLCTINGCPHCYPAPERGIQRICPVCHKNVPVKDGHLIARLFNKTDGKKHVVVTGCNNCSSSGKSR